MVNCKCPHSQVIAIHTYLNYNANQNLKMNSESERKTPLILQFELPLLCVSLTLFPAGYCAYSLTLYPLKSSAIINPTFPHHILLSLPEHQVQSQQHFLNHRKGWYDHHIKVKNRRQGVASLTQRQDAPILLFIYCFKTVFLCIAQATLKLPLQTRLPLPPTHTELRCTDSQSHPHKGGRGK